VSLSCEVSNMSETPHRPAIEIERHYGELPNVYCYPGQLNQVFMGILTNAIDILTPSAHPVQKAGSDPKTSGSSSLKQPTIRLMTEATEDYVRIHISDNGGGMDESTCHQIFDPFFTTKPVGSGMGLGLAMAYQIVVANHYGELTCTSAVGKGTTFTIEVPLTLKLKMQPVVTSPKLITA
ncbi:MAG: HAMP domain-containing sensor histidine kinase, partial [Cyanobacteria bacterium J06635_11]